MSKKKKLLIAVASILVVIAIGVGAGLGIGLTNSNKFWYKVNSADFIGSHVKEIVRLVGSTRELHSLYGESYNDTYDDNFFEKKSIIVITLNAPDSSIKYSVNDVYVEDETLTVEIIRKDTGSGMLVFYNWRIFIEVKKSDIKDVIWIDKIITETKEYLDYE